MRGRIKDLGFGLTGDLTVTLALPQAYTEDLRQLKDGDVEVEIKKYRNKRSRDANALCWIICHEIGMSMSPPLPKETVYRRAIRDVGEFVPLPIKEIAVDAFIRNWGANGVGWFAEDAGKSKLEGFRLVLAYYGSSTYDTKQMGRLLDYLVDEAEQIGITLRASKRDIEEAKRRWGDA